MIRYRTVFFFIQLPERSHNFRLSEQSRRHLFRCVTKKGYLSHKRIWLFIIVNTLIVKFYRLP